MVLAVNHMLALHRLPQNAPGRIALEQIKNCYLSESGELVVASEQKCHVFTAEPDSSVSIQEWHDAIQRQILPP